MATTDNVTLKESVRLALKQPVEIRERIRESMSVVLLIQRKIQERKELLDDIIPQMEQHLRISRRIPKHLQNLSCILDDSVYNDLFPLMIFYDAVNRLMADLPRRSQQFFRFTFFRLIVVFDGTLVTDARFVIDDAEHGGLMWIDPYDA